MDRKERRHFLWLRRSEPMTTRSWDAVGEKLLAVTLVFPSVLFSESSLIYTGLCYSCQFALLSVQVLLNKVTKGQGFTLALVHTPLYQRRGQLISFSSSPWGQTQCFTGKLSLKYVFLLRNLQHLYSSDTVTFPNAKNREISNPETKRFSSFLISHPRLPPLFCWILPLARSDGIEDNEEDLGHKWNAL